MLQIDKLPLILGIAEPCFQRPTLVEGIGEMPEDTDGRIVYTDSTPEDGSPGRRALEDGARHRLAENIDIGVIRIELLGK